MEDEIIEEFNGAVITTKFIVYDNDDNVISISGVPDDEHNNFEIDFSLIPNFINLKKNFRNYKIGYFVDIANGVITDEDDPEPTLKEQTILFEIPCSISTSADIVIKHDVKNKKWTVIANKKCLPRLKTTTVVPIYITFKNKPAFLIRTLLIPSAELEKTEVSIDFLDKIEDSLLEISVLTIKQFKEYCVKELK